MINRQNIAAPLSEFLGILVIGVLLWYGGKLVLIDMNLKPAAFITYMGLAYGVLTPAKSISKALYALKKGNAAAERVYELIDSENEFELQNLENIEEAVQISKCFDSLCLHLNVLKDDQYECNKELKKSFLTDLLKFDVNNITDNVNIFKYQDITSINSLVIDILHPYILKFLSLFYFV